MEETLLHVEGMSCPSCVRHVDAALKAVAGVEGVEVRLAEDRVRVVHADTVAARALAAALTAAGYPARTP